MASTAPWAKLTKFTMAFIYAETVDELGPARGSDSGYPEVTPAHASAVSWGSIVGAGIQAGGVVAGGVAATVAGSEIVKSDSETGPMGYFVDSLFRKDLNTAAVATAAPLSEVARIFMNTILTGPLATEDIRYVGQLVAQRTGLSQQEAEKRVTDTYARLQARLNDAQAAAKDAADIARQASAYAALWLFISLLIGAFIASLAATYGGRQRDA